MANGDVLACIIDKTGNYAHVKLSALSAGGSYSFNATSSSSNVSFTVTSPSFDNTGAAGTKTRTVYGTAQIAQPAGSHATTNLVTKAIPIGAVTGGPFVWGETVTQTGSGATAVVTIGTPASPLIVNTVSGTPNSSGVWTGGTSGATATPTATPTTYTGNPNWEGADGSDLWVRVAFNEPIYSGDTSIKLNTSSGWYTGATATANFSCTNQSTLGYPAVVAQWATVPAQRFTGALTLECQAFHHFATGGKPVACVVFTATDGTNTVTQTVTAMTVSTVTGAATSPIPTASATAGIVIGETVKQGTTNATATVVGSVTGKAVWVSGITGTPDATHAWVGQTSSVSITPTDKPPVAPVVSTYSTTINASSFNQSATVTCNFKAYPWIGDSGAPYDTTGKTAWASDGNNTAGPIPFIADKGNSYGITVAFVDPTSTFNTTSAVNTLVQDEVLTQATSGATAVFNYSIAGSPNQVFVTEITGTPDNSHNWTGGTSGAVLTPSTAPVANGTDGAGNTLGAQDISNIATAQAHPFVTVYWASSKIATFNNANHARNTADAGIVYMKKGRYTFINFNNGQTCNNSWLTITRAAGLNPGDARIVGNGNSTTSEITGLQRLYDMDVIGSSSGNFVSGSSKAWWFDSNRIVGGTSTNGLVYNGNTTIFTNNAAVNVPGQWAGFGSLGKMSLFRGNVSESCAGLNTVMSTGNAFNKGGGSGNQTDNFIFSFNAHYSVSLASQFTTFNPVTAGGAVVGNLIEGISGNQPTCWITADGNAADSTNYIVWHNTFAGARSNIGYCRDQGQTAAVRSNYSRKYCADTWTATKHDRFSGSDATGNKAWGVAYGVGHVGNHMITQSSTSFAPYYYLGIGCTDNAAANYTNDQAGTQDGDAQGAGGGNGDYHPLSTSPLRTKVTDPVIPFDLAGTAIGVGGAAGALQPLPSSVKGAGGVGIGPYCGIGPNNP